MWCPIFVQADISAKPTRRFACTVNRLGPPGDWSVVVKETAEGGLTDASIGDRSVESMTSSSVW